MSTDGFSFSLNQKNKITPRQLRKSDIMQLIRSNNLPELNSVLNDLSQENFSENDYFDFTKDELKLIKNYQVLTQYMIYSINKLTRKSQELDELANKQIQFNDTAEQAIRNKQKRISDQEENISELTNNCANLEYLIKQLHLEDKAKEAGIDINDNNNTLDYSGKYTGVDNKNNI